MKKYYSFIALAALALASCTSDEFVGGNEKVTTESKGSAIGFDFGVPNLTRGSLSGADAAEALNYQFVVYGTKHTEEEVEAATNDEVVFKNYKVEWTDNTAGTTESNTHNWEYVGLTPYAEGVSPVVTSTQTIKYWDYSANKGYTFYAFAGKDQVTAKNVTITKITEGTNSLYEKGYTVTIKKSANLDQLFYSDRTPVAKSEYGKPVVLTFRNLGSRVRVGFYETVPGYSVKINKFYYDDDASAAVTTFKAMDKANETNFTAALQNVAPADNNSLTITYYDKTDEDIENHVKVTNSGVEYGYNLTLGTGIIDAEKLAMTSATPTWDNNGNYTTVYPFEQNTNPMLIRVDYTLTAEDGSNETIEVKNARVVVPTNFVQWKSNYAYTYLFKISNNTNGTTGTVPTDPDDPESGDPEGLFPITFDAVAVTATDYTQETITTVATNNVTTYAVNSDVTTVGEYKAGETIYVVDENTSTHEPLTVSGIGVTAGNATVYTATTTGDAISEATVLAKLNGAPNGITLTAASPAATVVTEANSIPQADGSTYTLAANKAVQFTPASAGTYVYVYTNTAYVATEYEAAGDTFDAAETYFFKTDKDVYYAASGLSTDNFDKYKADLWKVKTDGTVGVYDIKVIIIK